MTSTGEVGWREDFEAFSEDVRRRLEAGEREYGNTADRRPMLELLSELREELADIVGWTFWVDRRIRRLLERVEEAEE